MIENLILIAMTKLFKIVLISTLAFSGIGFLLLLFIVKGKKGIYSDKYKMKQEKEKLRKENLVNQKTNTVIEAEAVEEIEEEHDVEGLLIQGGFHNDYEMMSEDQKNKVMLYLMILKTKNQITKKEYDKEIVELWKKSN